MPSRRYVPTLPIPRWLGGERKKELTGYGREKDERGKKRDLTAPPTPFKPPKLHYHAMGGMNRGMSRGRHQSRGHSRWDVLALACHVRANGSQMPWGLARPWLFGGVKQEELVMKLEMRCAVRSTDKGLQQPNTRELQMGRR